MFIVLFLYSPIINLEIKKPAKIEKVALAKMPVVKKHQYMFLRVYL